MVRIQWKHSGPRITTADLRDLSESLEIELPKDLANFLRRQNGGVPKPDTLRTSSGSELRIAWFYSLRTRRDSRELYAITQHFRHELELPKRFLPVALIAELNDVLLIRVARSAGKIVYWSIIEEGFSQQRVKPFCESLKDLFTLLTPSKAEVRVRSASRAAASAHGRVMGSEEVDSWLLLYDGIRAGSVARVKKAIRGISDPTRPPAALGETIAALEPPIFYAIAECNLTVFELIHAAGYDSKAKNSQGKSPRQALKQLITEAKRAASPPGIFTESMMSRVEFGEKALKLLSR
jgi:hypothetical protein